MIWLKLIAKNNLEKIKENKIDGNQKDKNYDYVWERGRGYVPKNFEFFFTKIEYGLYVLDHFDVLMSKIIFKK